MGIENSAQLCFHHPTCCGGWGCFVFFYEPRLLPLLRDETEFAANCELCNGIVIERRFLTTFPPPLDRFRFPVVF